MRLYQFFYSLLKPRTGLPFLEPLLILNKATAIITHNTSTPFNILSHNIPTSCHTSLPVRLIFWVIITEHIKQVCSYTSRLFFCGIIFFISQKTTTNHNTTNHYKDNNSHHHTHLSQLYHTQSSYHSHKYNSTNHTIFCIIMYFPIAIISQRYKHKDNKQYGNTHLMTNIILNWRIYCTPNKP